jgi:hypothetical protein
MMGTKKYSDEGKGLELIYPEDWKAELKDNVLSVYDELNGVGVLQFSTYHIPNPEAINLGDELSEFLKDKHGSIEINMGNNYASAEYLDDEERYWKYWLFLKKDILIFASYNCEKDDIGKDDKEIDKILRSSM